MEIIGIVVGVMAGFVIGAFAVALYIRPLFLDRARAKAAAEAAEPSVDERRRNEDEARKIENLMGYWPGGAGI